MVVHNFTLTTSLTFRLPLDAICDVVSNFAICDVISNLDHCFLTLVKVLRRLINDICRHVLYIMRYMISYSHIHIQCYTAL